MMKRSKSAWVCLIALCLTMMLTFGAAAEGAGFRRLANRIDTFAQTTYPDGALSALSCVSSAANAEALIDGVTSTVWTGGVGDWFRITLPGVTVGGVWLRNGDYSSVDAYQAGGRADIVQLTLTTAAGATYTYLYRMDAAYDIDTYSSAWQYGYQLLPLAQEIGGVVEVGVTVQSLVGTSAILSDVAVTGSASAPVATVAPANQAVLTGLTIDNLATRSGPATEFSGLGTYKVKGQYVTLVDIAYDVNGVGWVQAEVPYGGALRRVYTGLKRFDTSTFDLSALRQETPLNQDAEVVRDVTPRYGPGTSYGSYGDTLSITGGTAVTLIAYEGDYAQVQFDHYNDKSARWDICRVWVKTADVNLL